MTGESSLHQVRILQLPVELWLAALEHQGAIRRELEIVRSGLPDGAVPNRLFALIRELDARFGGLNPEAEDTLLAAADEGLPSVDLVYEVPVEAAEAAERLGAMLDEVDAYCREGDQLMSLATPLELVEFRQWFLGEFVGQLRGASPTPWPRFRDQRFEGPPSASRPESPASPGHPGEASGWVTRSNGQEALVEVETDLDLGTAPNLRDLLQDLVNRGIRNLTIDLSRGVFMDSLALSLFVTTHDRLAAGGGGLRLVVGDRLHSLLEAAELTQTFEVELRRD